MQFRQLLTKPWMRVIVLFWAVIFPIVFVALPLMKVVTNEAEFTMQPVWALAFWVLSPLAVSIVLKRFVGHADQTETQEDR